MFRIIRRIHVAQLFAFVLAIGSTANLAVAQLSFVEIMADSVDDTNWEWVEVLNTSNQDIDLNGYVYYDTNRALSASNISSELSANTVIPAGQVAVLYNGSNLEYNDQRFRNAWSLEPTVPLIGITSPPRLNNGGDQIALWESFEKYTLDLGDDGNGGMRAVQFENAVVSIDFGGDFPSPSGESIYWTGNGDINSAQNWLASEPGVAGAYASKPTFFETAQINSTDDLGNPGVVPGGTPGLGLLITEIMFNPRSDPDNSFEYVEIYNNTGQTIDFSQTPFFFDDMGGNPLEEPNLTTGTIADDSVAVLFNADAISEDVMKQAWGDDKNYIPVANFSALNNGGDGVGLWSDAAAYAVDRADDSFLDAESFVIYEDGDNAWPSDNGSASIYLSGLDKDQHVGANWLLAMEDDGLSFHANPAFQSMITDHPGGDIGSPGIGPQSPRPSGDFDNDGELDVDDIEALTAEVRAGTHNARFDLNGDNLVNADDRVFWVEVLRNTYFGDANLDGEFSSSDFVVVFTSALYETNQPATWSQGDWNGDGVFSSTDFVTAFSAGGYEKGPRPVAVVPEPVAAPLVLVGLVMLVHRFRSHRAASQV